MTNKRESKNRKIEIKENVLPNELDAFSESSNDNNKLYMVYENDVNSYGLWLYKKGLMKNQKGLLCNWVASSLTATAMQFIFAG